MTSITITLDTLDVRGAEHTWATALDAIQWCTPAMKSLSVHGAFSGDVDTVSHAYRVRVGVRGNADDSTPQAGPEVDTLAALMEAASELREVETRASIQDHQANEYELDGDMRGAEFCRQRARQHRLSLPALQDALDAAWVAHNTRRGA